MDWKSLIQKQVGIEVTDEEVEENMPYAKRKLSHIISREGDLNGERNQPWYLATLLGEIINMDRFSHYCIEKSKENMARKMKESTQHNIEMLPQTNIIVSQ